MQPSIESKGWTTLGEEERGAFACAAQGFVFLRQSFADCCCTRHVFPTNERYLSDKVALSGHGWTSASSQSHTGQRACVASCGYILVSFLFKIVHYLYISSPSEDGVGLGASLCLTHSGALELTLVCLNCGASSIFQAALLCSLPRKTAWISDQKRSKLSLCKDIQYVLQLH